MGMNKPLIAPSQPSVITFTNYSTGNRQVIAGRLLDPRRFPDPRDDLSIRDKYLTALWWRDYLHSCQEYEVLQQGQYDYDLWCGHYRRLLEPPST